MATVRSNSLGERLRRARKKGLTLERVARETKIPQRHARRSNANSLTAIPSGLSPARGTAGTAHARRPSVSINDSRSLSSNPHWRRWTRKDQERRERTGAVKHISATASVYRGRCRWVSRRDRRVILAVKRLDPSTTTRATGRPSRRDVSAPTPKKKAPNLKVSVSLLMWLRHPTQVAVPLPVPVPAKVGNCACCDDAAGRGASEPRMGSDGGLTSRPSRTSSRVKKRIRVEQRTGDVAVEAGVASPGGPPAHTRHPARARALMPGSGMPAVRGDRGARSAPNV